MPREAEASHVPPLLIIYLPETQQATYLSAGEPLSKWDVAGLRFPNGVPEKERGFRLTGPESSRSH